ncbi:hypothetical protein TNCV_1696361 [Trichonephila clavipes]|nr:hypothetical protein TNCV_1696361 [Trichonephila clavipes]
MSNELIDMHLMCGMAEGNARVTERLYHERHIEARPRYPAHFVTYIEQNELDTVRSNSSVLLGIRGSSESLNGYLSRYKLSFLYSNRESDVSVNRHLGVCETFHIPLQVLDESRSFFRVHTGYFSNIPKCIKAEFFASWACSQSSVVSSSQR